MPFFFFPAQGKPVHPSCRPSGYASGYCFLSSGNLANAISNGASPPDKSLLHRLTHIGERPSRTSTLTPNQLASAISVLRLGRCLPVSYALMVCCIMPNSVLKRSYVMCFSSRN